MTAADRPVLPALPHPELDTLADLQADVLDPAVAEDVAAHVAGCARCAAALAAFDAVGAELRSLPTPSMPAPVAARIDAALIELRRGPSPVAGPAGRPAGGADPPGRQPPDPPAARPVGAGAVADLSVARERRHRSLKIGGGAVAAAFVLLAAGASVTAVVTTTRHAERTADSTVAGANVPGEAAPGAASPSRPDPVVRVPSYTKETLRGSLGTISRESAVDVIAGLGETGPAGVMADAGRRQACEQSIAQRAGRLTAVRQIDYEGKQAYVFVFTDSSGRHSAQVVDIQCGRPGGLPATVLDSVS